MNTKILDKIKLLWSKHPELRFMQLIYNLQSEFSSQNGGYWIVSDENGESFDMFYLEDKIFEEFLDNKIEENKIEEEIEKCMN